VTREPGELGADEAALARLAALVRVPTISRAKVSETDWAAFYRFREVLIEAYPLVEARLTRELVAEHTLVYRWAGRDASLPPAVLMAHQDVVDPGDAEAWAHGPFGGEVVGGELHGRGTIDDKGALAAILEAVEALLADGFQPQRDVVLVFGHDEETHGTGAQAAALLLASRDVVPAFVLDEGGAIVEGALPGVVRPMAMIGLSEKGSATIRLSVEEPGGHASTPPERSAIGRLARAITRIDAAPFPARLTAATRRMFAAAGRGAKGIRGVLYRGVAWSAPILRRALERAGPETAAMVRTTRVATLIGGGHAQNAIPERAEATVNARILPGETVASVVEHLRAAVHDPLVRIEATSGWDPSPVSPTEGLGWELLTGVLADRHPEALPVPYAPNVATDSRAFTGLTRAVYRFTPFHMTAGERAALHAVGERIRVSAWLDGIAFYRELLRRL